MKKQWELYWSLLIVWFVAVLVAIFGVGVSLRPILDGAENGLRASKPVGPVVDLDEKVLQTLVFTGLMAFVLYGAVFGIQVKQGGMPPTPVQEAFFCLGASGVALAIVVWLFGSCGVHREEWFPFLLVYAFMGLAVLASSFAGWVERRALAKR